MGPPVPPCEHGRCTRHELLPATTEEGLEYRQTWREVFHDGIAVWSHPAQQWCAHSGATKLLWDCSPLHLSVLSLDSIQGGVDTRQKRTRRRWRLDTRADCLAQPAGVPAAHSRACERAAEPVFRACRPGAEAGHVVRISPALVAGRCRRPVDHKTASRAKYFVYMRAMYCAHSCASADDMLASAGRASARMPAAVRVSAAEHVEVRGSCHLAKASQQRAVL